MAVVDLQPLIDWLSTHLILREWTWSIRKMIIDKRKSDYWHETPLCSMCTVNIPSLGGELLATDRLRNGTACNVLHTSTKFQ
jgi:hypothetical protein